MITCPSCNAQLPDDTIHCGECGHKVEPGTGMKTMFGMAALSAENMAEAAQQAKAARVAAENAIDDAATQATAAVQGAPVDVPKLKLPSPGAPAPGLVEESSSVFDLARPGGDDAQKTIPVSSLQTNAPAPNISAPAASTPSGPTFESQMPGGSEVPVASSNFSGGSEPEFSGGFPGGSDSALPGGSASNFPGGSDAGFQSDTGPSAMGQSFPQDNASSGPTAFADTSPPGHANMPSSEPMGSALAGGGGNGGVPMGGIEEAPKNKTILYVIGGLAIAMLLCCIVSIVLNVVLA